MGSCRESQDHLALTPTLKDCLCADLHSVVESRFPRRNRKVDEIGCMVRSKRVGDTFSAVFQRKSSVKGLMGGVSRFSDASARSSLLCIGLTIRTLPIMRVRV